MIELLIHYSSECTYFWVRFELENWSHFIFFTLRIMGSNINGIKITNLIENSGMADSIEIVIYTFPDSLPL